MRRFGFIVVATALISGLALSPALASSSIYLTPSDQLFTIGDTLSYELFADIDEADAIIGFGFDLSFDGGATFVTGPGDSGSALTFDSFTPSSTYFTYDWFWDFDGDSISGVLNEFDDPAVFGTGILLGTFQFTAFALNPETIFLDADDVGETWSVEGLIPELGVSFMPNTPFVTATPVPEPASMLLFGAGLLGMAGLKKKNSANQHSAISN